MVIQVLIGAAIILFGVFLLVFRRRSLDMRMRWYEQHMPKLHPGPGFENAGYIFGSLLFIAFGVILIVGTAV
jgi:NADH:ubiquinone oxidoreductase subunit 3 (subunit A)